MAGSDKNSNASPDDRVRVLQVIEAAEGGTARHVVDLVSGIDRSRFAVDIAYSTNRCRGFVERIHERGTFDGKLIGLPMKRRPAPVADLLMKRRLAKIMVDGRYTVVHAHSTKAGWLARGAADKAGVPRVIYTPHGFAFWGRRGPSGTAVRLAEWWAAGKCSVIVCVSRREASLAMRAGLNRRCRVEIIENGIDLESVSPEGGDDFRRKYNLRPDDLLVAGVGRLVRQKGFDVLIDAAARLLVERKNIRFLVAGEGKLHDALQRRIDGRGLGDRFRLLGRLSDLSPLYNAADLVVAPSRWESCSYVILEAAAHGCPIVASDTAGGRGLCYRVPEGRADQFAAAIADLAEHPEERRRLGQTARQAVRDSYSLSSMIARIEQLYL